jgi:hypothetical protein
MKSLLDPIAIFFTLTLFIMVLFYLGVVVVLGVISFLRFDLIPFDLFQENFWEAIRGIAVILAVLAICVMDDEK